MSTYDDSEVDGYASVDKKQDAEVKKIYDCVTDFCETVTKIELQNFTENSITLISGMTKKNGRSSH